jgi:hypothetical protein
MASGIARLLFWAALGIAGGGCSSASAEREACTERPVGQWQATSKPSFAPTGAVGAWNGSELLVFRGAEGNWAYDPCTDGWRPIASGRPEGNRHMSGVVGARYVDWAWSSDGDPPRGAWLDAKGKAWTEMNMADAPVVDYSLSNLRVATFTSESVLVITGDGSAGWADARRYDLASNVWRSIGLPEGLTVRVDDVRTLVGDQLLVWGGQDAAGPLGTGFVYGSKSDQWHVITNTGAPSARHHAHAASTGKELLVWGGSVISGGSAMNVLKDGGVYDPVADAWRPITEQGAPDISWVYQALWTGTRFLVIGGNDAGTRAGGMYDPATGAWSSIDTNGMPENIDQAEAHSTPGGRAVFILDGRELWVFDPVANQWTAAPAAGAPIRPPLASAWTGTSFIAWGSVDNQYSDCANVPGCDPYLVSSDYFTDGTTFRVE